MKVIHTADLHLDSRLETNLDSKKARQRRKELVAAFENTVEYAEKNSVSLFIVAGDMFDSERVSQTTVETIASVIKKAQGIDFAVLGGNHDGMNPFCVLDTLPENLHLFSDKWGYFDFENVTVAGIFLAPHNVNIAAQGPELNRDRFNIVVMHGDPAQIRPSSLAGKNIDYLALGHIHEYSAGRIDGRGAYAYSGCLESRGFDESGRKGFVLLDTDKKSAELITETSIRTMFEISVDITGLSGYAEIKQAVEEGLEKNGAQPVDMVKIILTGSYGVDTNKDISQLLFFLQNRFYFAKLIDNSSMQICADDYKNDVSLKGEFVRQVLSSDLPDSDKDKIILCGIHAIRGEEIGD